MDTGNDYMVVIYFEDCRFPHKSYHYDCECEKEAVFEALENISDDWKADKINEIVVGEC